MTLCNRDFSELLIIIIIIILFLEILTNLSASNPVTCLSHSLLLLLLLLLISTHSLIVCITQDSLIYWLFILFLFCQLYFLVLSSPLLPTFVCCFFISIDEFYTLQQSSLFFFSLGSQFSHLDLIIQYFRYMFSLQSKRPYFTFTYNITRTGELKLYIFIYLFI